MRTTLLAFAGLCVAACGPAARARTAATPLDEPQWVESGGLRVLSLSRPMGTTVAVSLWLDVGSSDGPNASHALVAASLAAARSDTVMRVTPDATSFQLLCPVDALEGCFERLRVAIALRDVAEDDVARAQDEIRRRRTRSLADAARTSTELAVEALLGVPIHPLGQADDALTRESLQAFLRMHYGPNRAWVVVVGAHSEATLQRAAARIDGPLATSTRVERDPQPSARYTLDESHLPPAWTFAARGTSHEDAQAMVEAWRARARDAGVALFPTRLGWVATLTVRSSEASQVLHAATWMRARAALGSRREAANAWELSRHHGDAWSAQHEAEYRVAFAGAGQVDASLAATLDALLEPRIATLTQAESLRRISQDGSTMEVVDGLGGEEGIVELRYAGASTDGPSPGATVIAVEALRDTCFAEAEVLLDGARLRVVVRGQTVGLADRAARIVDCVASAHPLPPQLDRAQRARIALATVDAERRAAVARMLSADAPGWILPQGSRASLADTTLRDVEARIDQWSRAMEVRVGWPTQLDDEAIRSLASQILPPRVDDAEALPVHASTRPSAAEVLLVHADVPEPEVILALRVDGADRPGAGSALCETLSRWMRTNAVAPTWLAADEALGWSWCAVAMPAWPDAPAPSLEVSLLREDIDASVAARALVSDVQRADLAGAMRTHWEAFSAPTGELRVTLRRAEITPSPPPLRRR